MAKKQPAEKTNKKKEKEQAKVDEAVEEAKPAKGKAQKAETAQ